jgi:hypothetical protein
LLGGFTGELFAFKAQFNAFDECAVADLAKLILSCYAASRSIGAGAFLHFGAFLASNTANTNPHV